MLIECHILDLRESLQAQQFFRKILRRETDGRDFHQPELLYLRRRLKLSPRLSHTFFMALTSKNLRHSPCKEQAQTVALRRKSGGRSRLVRPESGTFSKTVSQAWTSRLGARRRGPLQVRHAVSLEDSRGPYSVRSVRMEKSRSSKLTARLLWRLSRSTM